MTEPKNSVKNGLESSGSAPTPVQVDFEKALFEKACKSILKRRASCFRKGVSKRRASRFRKGIVRVDLLPTSGSDAVSGARFATGFNVTLRVQNLAPSAPSRRTWAFGEICYQPAAMYAPKRTRIPQASGLYARPNENQKSAMLHGGMHQG